jgi:hypothetical protein
MKIFYFVSDTHDYNGAIYFGVGPRFGEAYGWAVQPISNLSTCECDLAVIDNRLEQGDVEAIQTFLSRPAARRVPICFRISDPDMPASPNPCVQFIFACGDTIGVHFATTYDIAGPFKSYVATLKRSRVGFLPYPYNRSREVDVDLAARRRQIFLSGAANPHDFYPVRNSLRSKRKRSPLMKLAVHELPHPGYPDQGASLSHQIVRERFVDYAAGFTHFLLCPSIHRSEFAKYAECAYAGSVPIGLAPDSLSAHVAACFITWRGSAWEIGRALLGDLNEMRERASQYRHILRKLRDPELLVAGFQQEMSSLI